MKKTAPFVCNGCPLRSKSSCQYPRRIYEAQAAQKEYETVLVESREGIPLATTEQIKCCFGNSGRTLRRLFQLALPLPCEQFIVPHINGNACCNLSRTFSSFKQKIKHFWLLLEANA